MISCLLEVAVSSHAQSEAQDHEVDPRQHDAEPKLLSAAVVAALGGCGVEVGGDDEHRAVVQKNGVLRDVDQDVGDGLDEGLNVLVQGQAHLFMNYLNHTKNMNIH
jgi:hypothetical protein